MMKYCIFHDLVLKWLESGELIFESTCSKDYYDQLDIFLLRAYGNLPIQRGYSVHDLRDADFNLKISLPKPHQLTLFKMRLAQLGMIEGKRLLWPEFVPIMRSYNFGENKPS